MLVRSPTLTKFSSGVSVNGSSPDRRIYLRLFGNRRAAARLRSLRPKALICSGVVPQQPPTILTRPERANSPDHLGHRLGRVVIAAEFVGQAGIGMRADQRVGDAGQFGDIGAQLLGAQRAIEADGEGVGVAHRMPERFRRLARQRAARQIGDGAGNPDRQAHAQFVERFLDGEDRGLGSSACRRSSRSSARRSRP